MSGIERSYRELIRLPTFQERFEYLKLNGVVGKETFGYDRYINQRLYQRSVEWKRIRSFVVVRDGGCDLAVPGYEIPDRVYVHHMNPITKADIENAAKHVFDPEYLITMAFETHNAVHYGDANLLRREIPERRPNDTCPWR